MTFDDEDRDDEAFDDEELSVWAAAAAAIRGLFRIAACGLSRRR